MNSAAISPLPTATLAKRLLSIIYDLFILGALSMAYSAIATAIMAQLANTSSGDYTPMQEGYWFQTGWVISIIIFYWFFWKRAGQTIGMRAWRLKVVDASGNLPSHKQCLLRILVGPIALAAAGIGYFWCLFNKDHAAWQDLASKTRVVLLPKLDKKKAS